MTDPDSRPSIPPLPGGAGDFTLLTAINVALDAPPGELPDRVAMVRHYLGAALDAGPGGRRATFKVLAHLIVRDLILSWSSPPPGADGTGRSGT
jgi:hypothetical protein